MAFRATFIADLLQIVRNNDDVKTSFTQVREPTNTIDAAKNRNHIPCEEEDACCLLRWKRRMRHNTNLPAEGSQSASSKSSHCVR